MQKLILNFDINGTITTIDSTDYDIDTPSRVNAIISKSIYGRLNDRNEWIMNDDPFSIHTGDISYHHYLKQIGLKHLAHTFTDDGNIGSKFRNYYSAIVDHEKHELLFKSFLNVLTRYEDAKLVLRTFGNDGSMVINDLNIKHGYQKPFTHAKYIRANDQHILKISNNEVIGIQNICDFITQHPNNLCIQDDYEYWHTSDNRNKIHGKPMIMKDSYVQLFFDDNDCVVSYDYDGCIMDDTFFTKVNTLQAMTNDDYYIRHIDKFCNRM